jgi:site-specific DNA recombinase
LQHLRKDENETWFLIETELEKLTDLNYIYGAATTIQKQQLIRIGFDSRLYYRQGIYRTPYIMPVLSHNELILKEKNLLLLDKKNGNSMEFPLGGAHGTTIELLHSLLSFIHSVKIA